MKLWPYPTTACGESRLIGRAQRCPARLTRYPTSGKVQYADRRLRVEWLAYDGLLERWAGEFGGSGPGGT